MYALDSGGRFPFTPFPDGWFFFELSRNMPAGKLFGKQWMGRRVAGWRNQEGRICVADAFCPHLEARLSPETGGVIEEGKLVCPFHGFTNDVSGPCVSTPNVPPTPACRLNLFPVEEVNGFVFAWFD
jgi:phenylpropionate dioxygenase-like ring-hydroxylating dioxygenase large terminal subunit